MSTTSTTLSRALKAYETFHKQKNTFIIHQIQKMILEVAEKGCYDITIEMTEKTFSRPITEDDIRYIFVTLVKQGFNCYRSETEDKIELLVVYGWSGESG